MPEAEIAARNGAVKYRTIRTKTGYIRIAIVRRKGKRGGTTVAGPTHRTKDNDAK